MTAVERVTFVAVSEVLGGGELYLLRTALAAGARVNVAVAGAPGTPVLAEASRLGLPTVELPLGEKLGRRSAARNLLRWPGARRRLRSFLERSGPGDWTLFQYKWEELLWGGEAAAERVAIWEHGPIPGALLRVPPARRRLARAFQGAAAAFAWSRPARDSIAALSGREPVMLSGGVEHDRAQAAQARRAETRAGLGVGDGDALIAYAGRLAEDKGVTAMVEVLPHLPHARAVVCGEGPMRGPLVELARRLDVGDRVTFTGFVADPFPYLAAADVLLLPTTSPGEGRPLVALESSALGTPVLGLEGSAAMEALRDEGRAHLVAGGGPESLATGIERLAREPRRPVPTPTWEETAERFLEQLEAAR